MSKEDIQLPLFDNVGPSLRQARENYLSNLREGTNCPCCGRYGKIYRRKLNSAMAVTLIKMYQLDLKSPGEWIHMIGNGNFGLPSRDYSTLKHWGLTEEKTGAKKDGNPDNGFYRITESGKLFVENRQSVPKYVYIYSDQKFKVDDVDELTNIRKSLGDGFNYDELMIL